MGITVVCQACGTRRTVPAHLYDEKIRGRVVKIPCRSCGKMIAVDGTMPPPADTTPTTEDLMNLVIPEPPKVPRPIAAPPPPPVVQASDASAGSMQPATPAREKLISHVDGPISERGPSSTVGRYALFEQFASGGMATVHFGRLDGAGGFARVVAIKRLLPHLIEDRDFTEMLLKEARLAARVRHPNVVATLDVVATKGDVLLVLDYVHGEALSTLCRTQAKERKEQVPLPIAISILLDMLAGLAAIHDATDEKGRSLGLVHRDISPPNVLVGADGVARVLDFGIATAIDHIEETAHGRKGKRGYMSPEQLRGERVTQRSDVFAAGVVIWEVLAMRRLFPSDQEKEPGEAVLRGDYPDLAQYRPELSPELVKAVMRAISLDPQVRFATMHELADAFEAAAPPRANARRIAEWVLDLARDALAERTRMVARAENWVSDVEIPLKSTPFAAELPLRPRSPSSPPPPVEEPAAAQEPAPAPVSPSSVPPLPASVSAAIEQKARESAHSLAPAAKGKSKWWVWLLLALGVAAYFALRST
jgi:serine/threonine-protein kinase